MKRLGHDLMRPTKELFALWKRVRDGTISRADFRRRMQPIRDAGGGAPAARLLQRADARLLPGTVEHREWLWTFVDVDGVEPTNNAAERRCGTR